MQRKTNLKKTKKPQTNYLDLIPLRAPLAWTTDEAGIVTLEKENTGLFCRITQKLLKKPKITYIHLDAIGSFLWPRLDGSQTVYQLADAVKAEFGEAAEPLYPRIAKYFQILESYHFVQWKGK